MEDMILFSATNTEGKEGHYEELLCCLRVIIGFTLYTGRVCTSYVCTHSFIYGTFVKVGKG